MPIKLSTTVQKIVSLPDKDNSLLLNEFYEYMNANGVSENNYYPWRSTFCNNNDS